MRSNPAFPRQRWGQLALTLFTFFFLLGSRSLNEPDEGRYAEIAREMVELNDWLVPHLWYVPHLDKPPLTYWAVAVSISVFGQNEWAVRLPLAMAGMSGVWVSYLFGLALGGQRVGVWNALILQSSLLYFFMARMLTTDVYLTQFIAWAGSRTVPFRRSGRTLVLAYIRTCSDGFAFHDFRTSYRTRAWYGDQESFWASALLLRDSGRRVPAVDVAPPAPTS